MKLTYGGRTDVGRVRTRNEDALLERPERALFAVADGMGGHAAGDIASRMAVDVLDEATLHPADDVAGQLEQAVRAGHGAILKAARADSDLDGMGTTLTAVRLLEESQEWLVAHVGDSRAYLWRDGDLRQLTRDQTWVQDQVDAGQLNEAQARTHPFSAMLTCALGIGDVDLDVQLIRESARHGDLMLLCSDGLTARLQDSDLRPLLASTDDLVEMAGAMVDRANEVGGPDNITVCLVRAAD